MVSMDSLQFQMFDLGATGCVQVLLNSALESMERVLCVVHVCV